MARSRALTIAAIAIVLLVVSITADATMARTYFVDAKDQDGWHTVAQQGSGGKSPRFTASPIGGGVVTVDPNGSIPLRLREDNGYFWSATKHYTVTFNGAIAAEGDITAPSRGVGESEFNLSAPKVFASSGAAKEPAPGTTSPASGPRTAFPNFVVDVDGMQIYVGFQVQEASS